MDSKLVIEQMAGRWKIKHPDMKPLALAGQPARAGRDDVHLDPAGAEQVRRPDPQRGARHRRRAGRRSGPASRRSRSRSSRRRPKVGWSKDLGSPTTLVLVRHGATDHTTEKRFSGRGGDDPALNADGRAQVRAVADWLAPLADEIDVVVTLPAAADPGDRRDHRRAARAPGRGRGRPGRGRVRHLGRAHLPRGAAGLPRRPRRLARLARRLARRGATRSRTWTGACAAPSTGC